MKRVKILLMVLMSVGFLAGFASVGQEMSFLPRLNYHKSVDDLSAFSVF